MNIPRFSDSSILVVGSCPLTSSIVTCLLKANSRILLYSDNCPAVEKRVALLTADPIQPALICRPVNSWLSLPPLNEPIPCRLAIVLTAEDEQLKKDRISQLEAVLPADALIVINTESIALDALQQDAQRPDRVLGANWSEPAHTTCFLEIISTSRNRADWVDDFCQTARAQWNKDPYVLRHGLGIRTRILCALIREAFFLIENGYVSVEDIDRACRNDAGYYLPFSGTFRYMDLMGTYIYGLVMRDLNPELSKDRHVPQFFTNLIEEGGRGMVNGRGFYQYKDGEAATWEAQFQQFSQQIAQLMHHYPFRYDESPAEALP